MEAPRSRLTVPVERVTILSDFDGTISVRDCNEALGTQWLSPAERAEFRRRLFEAGTPLWEVLDASLIACAVPLEAAIAHLQAHVPLDPGFAPFSRWCEDRGWPLRIVSAGLTEVIAALLARDGLTLPIAANRARRTPTAFGLDPVDPACPTGVDKAAIVLAERAAGALTVFIGDGLSDRLAVPHADLVFSKGALSAYCDREGIPHVPVSGFAEVQAHLRTWRPVPPEAREPR